MIVFVLTVVGLSLVGTVSSRRQMRWERRAPLRRLVRTMETLREPLEDLGAASQRAAESMRQFAKAAMSGTGDAFLKMQADIAAFTSGMDTARSGVERVVISEHPDLSDWDREMDNCYPNLEWPDTP